MNHLEIFHTPQTDVGTVQKKVQTNTPNELIAGVFKQLVAHLGWGDATSRFRELEVTPNFVKWQKLGSHGQLEGVFITPIITDETGNYHLDFASTREDDHTIQNREVLMPAVEHVVKPVVTKPEPEESSSKFYSLNTETMKTTEEVLIPTGFEQKQETDLAVIQASADESNILMPTEMNRRLKPKENDQKSEILKPTGF
jgi:hypothetical protein